jgi:hypothetical protein
MSGLLWPDAVYHQWGLQEGRMSKIEEGRMSKIAIRLLTLVVYATVPVVIPMVIPAKAETSSSNHLKKHKKQKSPGIGDLRSAGQAWPLTRPSSQADVCPGNARGIDCKTWPPPMYDDPDRRNGGVDR